MTVDHEHNASTRSGGLKPFSIMAAIEISRKKPRLKSVVLALISLGCLVLVFSFLQSSNPNKSAIPYSTVISLDLVKLEESGGSRNCNYSDGRWIRDLNRPPVRYDSSCKEIFKGWKCISAGKSNAGEINNWPWQPFGCDLPRLDLSHFLRRYRNVKIGKGYLFSFL